MSGSQNRFAVLLFSDLVGSTDLKQRHGVPAFADALRVHNGHFERVAGACRGLRILQNMGDGYFAEGDSVSEVVKFALLFQDAMRPGPWGDVLLTARVMSLAVGVLIIHTATNLLRIQLSRFRRRVVRVMAASDTRISTAPNVQTMAAPDGRSK